MYTKSLSNEHPYTTTTFQNKITHNKHR
uniref:Uncharacterized protein n=1 Tax=Anguilla anguilla TaxID=7936 RepID=A0A0E9W0W8_ANGAN